MSKKIFIGNYKGGVAKTTSVFSIAMNLAENHGKKILLLDIDPQSSLSEVCLRNCGKELSELKPNETLNYVFDMYINKIQTLNNINLSFNLNEMIKKVDTNNGCVEFIPSSLLYREKFGLDELTLSMQYNIEYLSILKQFTDLIDEKCDYDHIFIDCPPTSNIITLGAFLMSDYYAIPTILDGISTYGIVHYINRINDTYDKFCKEDKNHLFNKHIFGDKPKLIGVFYTLMRRQVNYTTAERELRNELSKLTCEKNIYIFSSRINNLIDISRNIAEGELSEKNPGDYEELSDEFLDRLSNI